MGAQWKAKHKDVAANAKGRLFGKLAKDIMIAARHGADPAANARLRLVVEQARKVSMPKDTLERAIKKGAGLLDGPANYETVVYEGFAPHQVPVIVECLTDNKNRSAMSIRQLFRKGQLATSGAISWDFKHLGQIEAALSYMEDFSPKGTVLAVMKEGIIGDCHAELGDLKKAMKYYISATEILDTDELMTPHYLKKVGMLHQLNGDNEQAIVAFQKILYDYPNSFEATDIEKYIGRLEAN